MTKKTAKVTGAGLPLSDEELAKIEEQKKDDKEALKLAKAEAKTAKAKAPKLYYYWVKIKSYISPEKIVKPSLYVSTERIARFFKAPNNFVEAYEEEIPDAKVYDIAKKLGVSISSDVKGKVTYVEADVLLGKLAKQL